MEPSSSPSVRFRAFATHHWHFSVLQIACAALLIWWAMHVPAPGYAIGTLAVLAAAMSIHTDMRGWQKGLWMLLMGGCLLIEFHSIKIDRQQHDKEVAEARREEREKFQSIADGIKQSIATGQQQFVATMSRTNDVLNNVTGGNSYAVVLPSTYGEDTQIPLSIENHGQNVLTGVTVMIVWQGAFAGRVPTFLLDAINRRVNVGTIAPGQRQWLGGSLNTNGLSDVGQNGDHVLCAYVLIYAQNFMSEEFLYLKKQDKKWLFKYGVYRQLTSTEREAILQSTGKIVSEKKLEEIDWTDNLNKLRRIGRDTNRMSGIR